MAAYRLRKPFDAGLARLLRPRTIAAVGGVFAENVIHQCRRLGFQGEIWPVNPGRDQLCDLPCYPNVSSLPGPVDAAFVGVNRDATVDVVSALSQANAGGAVCYASGYGEAGAEGHELQAALVSAAGSMPLLGPNTYGFINYLDGALLWPDVQGGHRVERGVAVITQSSNLAINITMQRRGLPIAYVLTLGNQAVVDMAHAIDATSCDQRVSAIGLHIEGLGDVQAFVDAVRLARERGMPCVAMKTGRSQQGATLARSHSAALAGNDAVVNALFERIGVGRVKSPGAFLESLKILHCGGALGGAGVVSLSCSGGEATLMSDLGMERRLEFPAFSEVQQSEIAKTTNPLVTVSNPFDYHTFDFYAPQRLRPTFEAVMRTHRDLFILVMDFPRTHVDASSWDEVASVFVDAVQAAGQRGAVLATFSECLDDARAVAFMDRGVVPLLGMEDGLAAVDAAIAAGAVSHSPALAIYHASAQGERVQLAEREAKERLAAYGLKSPRAWVCHSLAEARDAFRSAYGPVVMKAIVPGLVHKTEAKAVVLHIDTEGKLENTFSQLSRIADGDQANAVLLEAQVEDVVAEIIIGATRDPVVGLHLLLGIGGIYAEALADVRTLLLPVAERDVLDALRSLKLSALLEGWRGGPKADLEAVVEAVLGVQRFVLDHRDRLLELDINPLIVCRTGAVVADALVVLRNASANGGD